MGIHSRPHRLLRRLTTEDAEDAEDATEKSLRNRRECEPHDTGRLTRRIDRM